MAGARVGPNWAIESAAVRVESNAAYQIVLQQDGPLEHLEKRVDLSGSTLRIESPSPGSSVRFVRSGTRDEGAADRIVLRDVQRDECYTITVSESGQLRLR